MDARQGSGGLRVCLLGVLWHLCLSAASLVSITVEPVKNGRPMGRIIQAVLADGKALGPASSPPPNAAAAP